MNKNKWFLNGGRGSGRTIRLLCETYENKIADLEDKLANADFQLEGRDNEIAELEQENKVLAQNLEDTEIVNKALEKEIAERKTDYEVLSCSVGDFGELQDKLEEEQRKNNGLSDNLTKAKEIIKNLMVYVPVDLKEYEEAEHFLKENSTYERIQRAKYNYTN